MMESLRYAGNLGSVSVFLLDADRVPLLLPGARFLPRRVVPRQFPSQSHHRLVEPAHKTHRHSLIAHTKIKINSPSPVQNLQTVPLHHERQLRVRDVQQIPLERHAQHTKVSDVIVQPVRV